MSNNHFVHSFGKLAFWKRHIFNSRLDGSLIILILVTIAGLAARLIYINQPVGNDEAYTYLAYSSRSIFTVITDYSEPNNHIFHSILVFLITHILGGESWVVRLPALIAGVSVIPAGYFTARRLYGSMAGLLAAIFIAVSPPLISYSASARGYTLIWLFSILCIYLAAGLIKNNRTIGWILFGLFAALGFYTIPIMLYPFAGICIWLLLNFFQSSGFTKAFLKQLTPLMITGLSVVIVTIILYLPVVIWGSGYHSIIANGVVSPVPFNEFLLDNIVTFKRTWKAWNTGYTSFLVGLQVLGVIISSIFHRHIAKQPVHILPAMIIVIFPILLVQRVVPPIRVWLFMLPFYLIWAGAGLAALLNWLKPKISQSVATALMIAICLLPIANQTIWIIWENPAIINAPGVEEIAANYLHQELSTGEMVIAVPPTSTQIKFYFSKLDNYERWFYNTYLKQDFSSLIVVVATNSDESLESVVEKNHLSGIVDIYSAEQIFSYKHMIVYSVNKHGY
jgi:hypothetical protein